jgi:hypothetical protein
MNPLRPLPAAGIFPKRSAGILTLTVCVIPESTTTQRKTSQTLQHQQKFELSTSRYNLFCYSQGVPKLNCV